VANKKTPKRDGAGDPLKGSEGGYTVDPQIPVSVPENQVRAAMEKMLARNEEMIQLVNMTMGSATLWVPSGVGTARAAVSPFQLTPPVSATFAEKIMLRRPPTRFDPQRYVWHPLPPPRPEDGGERQHFTDKNTGQRIFTSTYLPEENVTSPNGKRIFHSVSMGQNFVARLRTSAAIRRYVREFDPRPEVTSYAALVIDYRERSRLDRMGLGAVETATPMN